jgi:hypothetical protein
MRIRRWPVFALLAVALALIDASAGRARRPPVRIDPNRIFNQISKGEDSIALADLSAFATRWRGPQGADEVNDFVRRHNITNGRITREQFAIFFQERLNAGQRWWQPVKPRQEKSEDRARHLLGGGVQ